MLAINFCCLLLIAIKDMNDEIMLKFANHPFNFATPG